MVRSYRGVKFKHLGRNRSGLDCIGPVFAAMIELGRPLVPFRAYKPQPDPKVLMEALRDRAREVELGQYRLPGRLLCLSNPVTFHPQHFVTTLGDGWAFEVTSRGREVKLPELFVGSVWHVLGVDYT